MNALTAKSVDLSIIDLTHTLHSHVPTWDGCCGFQKKTLNKDTDESLENRFLVHGLEMRAGIGTHMDAPCHYILNAKHIAEIDLKELVAPLFVLDVSHKAHASYQISVEDIISFEAAYGKISANSLVIAYTGWSRYWNEPTQYRNADENGQVWFPSFHAETAPFLLERGISGLGIDTLSPDLGTDGQYPLHQAFLGAGKYLVENVANAHLLPPTGAIGVLLPIKVEAAEAPIRFVAFI